MYESTPCTIYLVEGRVGENWVPLAWEPNTDTVLLGEQAFVAFTSRAAADDFRNKAWLSKESISADDVRVARRVARTREHK